MSAIKGHVANEHQPTARFGGRAALRTFAAPLAIAFVVVACGSSTDSAPDGGGVNAEGGKGAREAGKVKPPPGMLKPTSTDGGACTSASPDETGCGCNAGQTHACYTGTAATRGIGACHDGMQTCEAQGEFASFGPCTGQVLPTLAAPCTPPPPPPPPHDAGVDAGCKQTTTCATLGLACGPATDNCGNPLACGTCQPGDTCTSGTCMAQVTTLTVGAPCTPGQVAADPGDAGMPQGVVILPGGDGASVFYCDSSSVWETFPAGACTQTACETCMQTNCSMWATGACTQAFQWLATCGPDRATYFEILDEMCGDNGSLMECKNNSCTTPDAQGEPIGGPCSYF